MALETGNPAVRDENTPRYARPLTGHISKDGPLPPVLKAACWLAAALASWALLVVLAIILL
jgi:hypothetical protein